MTLYAYYDPKVSENSPVIGWYNTNAFNYPNLPKPKNLVELNSEQWEKRTDGLWAIHAGALVPYIPSVPPSNLAQQALTLLSGGLSITSKSSPDIDAIYSCSLAARSHIQAEILTRVLTGTFVDGKTSIDWPDIDGKNHKFISATQFQDFGLCINSFVANCTKVFNGTSTILPSSKATII